MKKSLRIALTLAVVVVAVLVGKWTWDTYLYSPWTRDGRVRADVITIAADVSGRITRLAVSDSQQVKTGDLLFVVDDERYQAVVDQDRAQLDQAKAQLDLAQHQLNRRQRLGDSQAISSEDLETFRIQTESAKAAVALAQARLKADQINLQRTRITAPADGTLINLNLSEGNYVQQGSPVLSLVKQGSFYVTGYFEETKIQQMKVGAAVTVKLMGLKQTLTGHVRSIGQGISNSNTATDSQLLPQVQQSFNWVRLAQRIPVDIALDNVPDNAHLSAGMTASVRLTDVSDSQ